MPELRKRAATVALLALAAACGSSERGAAQNQGQQTPPAAIREQLGTPTQADKRPADALSSAFRSAAAKALPAVVFIQVEKEMDEEQQQIPEPFRRFFGIPPGEEGEEQPIPGAGSGFILDAEGHVITNNHGVEGAQQVIVRLVDGREFPAKVLGNDEQTDVAVIKIEPPNGAKLPTSQIGSSDGLQVGDWVLALGSPLELEFTVTAGIVSATGRQLGGDPSALQAFIQTDAAINPGNSGGPLVDLNGDVVGINSAIFGGPRFVGYGFAIPITLANKVVQDILRYGHVRRPMLGVQIQRVSEADAEVYGLPEIRGAEVVSITAGSPAERAGLRIGDVILSLDGKEINLSTDLTTGLAQHQPGERVRLEIWRQRQRRQVEVELGEFDRGEVAQTRPTERHEVEAALGFRVETLTEELARELELDRTTGVVISQVSQLSPAANAGVRPGMLLLAINGEDVRSVRDVERLAAEVEPGRVISLRVRAGDAELIINYRTRR
jgi:serine protease Do